MTEMPLSAREKREIRALADASYEALLETVKASRARQAKRLKARAARTR